MRTTAGPDLGLKNPHILVLRGHYLSTRWVNDLTAGGAPHTVRGPENVILKEMTIQRMDNVGIVIDDLAATIDFFTNSALSSKGKR